MRMIVSVALVVFFAHGCGDSDAPRSENTQDPTEPRLFTLRGSLASQLQVYDGPLEASVLWMSALDGRLDESFDDRFFEASRAVPIDPNTENSFTLTVEGRPPLERREPDLDYFEYECEQWAEGIVAITSAGAVADGTLNPSDVIGVVPDVLVSYARNCDKEERAIFRYDFSGYEFGEYNVITVNNAYLDYRECESDLCHACGFDVASKPAEYFACYDECSSYDGFARGRSCEVVESYFVQCREGPCGTQPKWWVREQAKSLLAVLRRTSDCAPENTFDCVTAPFNFTPWID